MQTVESAFLPQREEEMGDWRGTKEPPNKDNALHTHWTHRVVYVVCNTTAEEDKTRGGEEKVGSSLLHLFHKLNDLLKGTKTMLGRERGRGREKGRREGGREKRKEGGREGERKRRREGGRGREKEGGREGGGEKRKEGGRKGERKGRREGEVESLK